MYEAYLNLLSFINKRILYHHQISSKNRKEIYWDGNKYKYEIFVFNN